MQEECYANDKAKYCIIEIAYLLFYIRYASEAVETQSDCMTVWNIQRVLKTSIKYSD